MTQPAGPRVTTRTIEAVETENLVQTDQNDGTKDDNLRHIVRPADNPHIYKIMKNPTGQDVVDIARVRGLEVTALCGKVWVPKNNPEGRDTCDTCVAMAGYIKSNG